MSANHPKAAIGQIWANMTAIDPLRSFRLVGLVPVSFAVMANEKQLVVNEYPT